MNAKIVDYVDIDHIRCIITIKDWEDAVLDGKPDDPECPQMPCITDDGRWLLEIDPDTGVVENWPKGRTAKVEYPVWRVKVYYHTTADDLIHTQLFSVPDFLDPDGDSCGCGVCITIDEDGKIKDWPSEDTIDLTFETDF